jgi:resuscitation-promoting factor RpfA
MALLSRTSTSKNIVRLAVAGAIALGAPLAAAGTAQAAPAGVWDRLAQCESSGNWSANTGNGFSGGLQFTPSTWKAFGGDGQAHNASRAQQIAVAERVLDGQGWGAWPACSSKLGLR